MRDRTLHFDREQTEREQKKKTQAAVVKKLLKNVEKKLGGEDVKATLGDSGACFGSQGVCGCFRGAHADDRGLGSGRPEAVFRKR